MNEFLKLNGNKLRFAFFITSLLFLAIVLTVLAIGFVNGKFPDEFLLATILLGAGIGFPVFILTITCFEWLSKAKVRKNAFAKNPFNKLDKIGFSSFLINEKSKWVFTEESKVAVINGFKIEVEITRESPDIIQFKAKVHRKRIDYDGLKQLEKCFEGYSIILGYGEIIKVYNIDGVTIMSHLQLESDLIKFTELLKNKQFEPQKNIEY
ncbi:hypothetical protein [Aureibacter tunicatorum]|uniref:Uncharacterized protein n=1 Tax=Aureibacter tunicatorum TaxID=866807 RepID=A0AAE4BUM4_9BACT|nr:hypothetical protein [Aureibacter tunicatorum]MDR6240942.1 hypothetical protein [Aureibacter tunicatorum]BDD03722.1 hypothetical protein AUTU_12050 [Aureibacter tunicatorum]